ncbi:hypothetical protein [Lactococcus petauri]|uniref:hypothetical protein n=1 Tax=Lactococcus petauri TaxID=1940789 RepID=UPI001FAFA0D7|nr:hypothetical protein [Lactococcus petauri]
MQKEELNKEQTEENYSYSDLFFEKGHWLLKIKQLLIALLGWVCFIVPTFITIASFLYKTSNGKYGIDFWKFSEGVFVDSGGFLCGHHLYLCSEHDNYSK